MYNIEKLEKWENRVNEKILKLIISEEKKLKK